MSQILASCSFCVIEALTVPAMEQDHYHTLRIQPLPSNDYTPLQRCMLLVRVSREVLCEGFNKASKSLEEQGDAEGLKQLQTAWEVLSDNGSRSKYNFELLQKATQDSC